MLFIGDTHGLRPVLSIIDKHKFTGQNLIHVGDFGLGFVSAEQDIRNLLAVDEALIETNNQLYVIRGNHDNPIFWDKSKGLNLPKFHNLHLVDDYTIYSIENQNVLFIGGAISIDRRPRMDDKPWPSWWKDEVFEYKPKLLEARLDVHKNVDIVITHTAPDFCHPRGSDNYLVNQYHEIETLHGKDLHEELREERASMTELYNDLTIEHNIIPKWWFYGHFHHTKKQHIGGTKFKLLNINEVYEINQLGEGVPH